MGGLLSGLASLGLDNLENMSIFGDKEKKDKEKETAKAAPVELPKESDFVYDKVVECPVCGEKFNTKVVKSGKAKLVATDLDLRPKYEGVDTIKYDVAQCTTCGYAALPRYFTLITPTQVKMIRETICKNVILRPALGDTYTYDEAIERYKLALATAVVKRAKNSEKAYLCLKSAWVMRGYLESGELDANPAKKAEIQEMEAEYIKNAYSGFLEARQSENYPMCGMDESTIDYLTAALALAVKDYDIAGRMVQSIMTSKTANKRAKDRAYVLKEKILAEKKG